jgi:phosphatidylserine/phosphatidylglycerophosphate/cardiolipin synthase-like enzyme
VSNPSFANSSAARIAERDYFDLVLAHIESARRRIWASLFIFDVRPSRDLEGRALEIAAALISRKRLGVDVRILTTGDVASPDIAVANLATGLYLYNAGVPVRRLFRIDDRRQGSHAKFAICDDVAFLGSQNWTDDAFRLNIEDGVLAKGEAAELVADQFMQLWALGRGMPRAA